MNKRLCIICWDYKEKGQIKYCKKCYYKNRLRLEANRKRRAYKKKDERDKRKQVALNWYYANKEKVLEQKKIYYKEVTKQRVLERALEAIRA
jgi:hypothetical protein